MPPKITVSVVSHNQRALVENLLADIGRYVSMPVRVVLTVNIPEAGRNWSSADFPFELEVTRNSIPKGFGENHNAALARARSDLFCVLNPDIRFTADPFPPLAALLMNSKIGVVSPAVTAPDLTPEDHARDFPSIFSLAAKAFGVRPHSRAPAGRVVFYPDWVAGMFMLFRTETLRAVHGFDERYFLYYEDVDLCARLRQADYEVAVCSDASVIHAARRESRKNLRYAKWHLRSALRFFASRPRVALGLGKER